MRHFTHISTIVLLTLAGPLLSAATTPPNILFIFCDDLGYGDVGAFHQNGRADQNDRHIPYFTTPQLDQMAENGMKLTQHYCAAPVCAPSRASLLTGLTQGHANIRDNQFDQELADTHTLGSVMQQAGYATAAFGKWGLQGEPDLPGANDRDGEHKPGAKFPGWSSYPTKRGFDYFLGYVRHRDGHYHYPKEDQKQLWENQTEISKDFDLSFTTDLFTAAAKKWIVEHRKQHPEKPFFAYLAHDTPHAKLQNPPCAYPAGGGLNGGVQWTGKPGAMINTAKGTYDGWMHPDFATATWDHDRNPNTKEIPWPIVQQRYANNVRRIDDTVGDLMQLLSDLGIADNTLIVFSSDNGPSEESYIKKHPYIPTFFEGYGPFEGIKRDVLEGGLRVPTIVHWPSKIQAGANSGSPSGHWDWLATFADAAGLTIPAASDGVSLLPTLTGGGTQAASTIYSEYAVGGRTPNYPAFDPSHRNKIRRQMQVVMADGYKGLRTGIESADDDFEIYDLNKDPKELRNLASQPGFEKVQATMKARALQGRLPHPTAKRPYDEAPIPALNGNQGHMPGALAHIAHGAWPWMPQLEELPLLPMPKGFTWPTGFTTVPDSCAIKLEAVVHIPADGRYTFTVESNSHDMLFVHDIRLLDELKAPQAEARSASLPLKAGWHPVRLLYRKEQGKPSFSMKLTGPDGKAIPLTGENVKSLTPGW